MNKKGHSSVVSVLHRLWERWRNNINAKIFTQVFVWATVLALMWAGFQLWGDYGRSQQHAQADLQRSQSTTIPLVATALWNVDEEQLTLAFDALVALPGVTFVRITERGSVVREHGAAETGTEIRIYPLHATVMGETLAIGQVEVGYSNAQLWSVLLVKYGRTVAYSLALILVVSTITWYTIEKQMTRYLRRVARFVRTRTAENLHESMHIQHKLLEGHRNDEIAILVRSVIAMQRSVRTAIETVQTESIRRAQAQERIVELNQTLELRVQERTQALERSQQAAQSVLELTHSAFWSLDYHSNLVHLDAHATEILGLTEQAASDFRLPDLLDAMAQGDDAFALRLHLLRQEPDWQSRSQWMQVQELGFMVNGAQRQQISFVTGFRRPVDGRNIWIEVLGWPQKNGTQEWEISGSLQDVTAQKKAEHHLQQMNLELQAALQRVQATQAQLLQSEKLAAIGQLMASVAHEINTPMGAIKSSGESIDESLRFALTRYPALLRELDGAGMEMLFRLLHAATQETATPLLPQEERKQRAAVLQVLQSAGVAHPRARADILTQLHLAEKIDKVLPLLSHPHIDEMLDTAYRLHTIQLGTNNINESVRKISKIINALRNVARTADTQAHQAVDVVENLETVLTLYGKVFRSGVTLVREFADNLPAVSANPDALSQVWNNLILNAVQAMQHQGVLTVSAYAHAQGVSVEIADTGPGIADDVAERIFDDFFTTKPLGEGTGLGLGIAKRIVQEHQGTISVQTRSQEGACFCVHLPFFVNSKDTTATGVHSTVSQ